MTDDEQPRYGWRQETVEELAARTGWPIEFLTARVVFRAVDPDPAPDRQESITDSPRPEEPR